MEAGALSDVSSQLLMSPNLSPALQTPVLSTINTPKTSTPKSSRVLTDIPFSLARIKLSKFAYENLNISPAKAVKRAGDEIVSFISPMKKPANSELESGSPTDIRGSPPSVTSSGSSSPEHSLTNTTIQAVDMESLSQQGSHVEELSSMPILDDSSINPQLKNLLMMILTENRNTSAKILAMQTETTERLVRLENSAKLRDEQHKEDFDGIRLRLDAVEKEAIVSKAELSNKIHQISSLGHSDSVNVNTQKVINVMADRLEAQDKFNRKNNIEISGLEMKTELMMDVSRNFLREKFNYSGLVSNIRPSGKVVNGQVKTVVVTLESWEAKMNILRTKKDVLNKTNVYIQPDFTEKEKKIRFDLRVFVRNFQAPIKKIIYSYQKVSINGTWFKWDETTQGVLPWVNSSNGRGHIDSHVMASQNGSLAQSYQVGEMDGGSSATANSSTLPKK